MSRTDTDPRSTQDSEEETERAPINLAWVLSLGVIVLALLGAITVIVVVRGNNTATAPQQPVPAPGSPSVVPSASAGAPFAPCAPVDQAQGGPITEAPVTTWDLVDTLAVPTTAGGPGKVEGSLATCYSPDTLGALTAAAQIYLRANVTGGDTVREQQTTPDSQWQTAAARQQWEANPPQKPWLQLRGFSTGAIENNRVNIDLQLKSSTGELTPVIHLIAIWTGTDWVLGASSSPPSQDASALILWEGV